LTVPVGILFSEARTRKSRVTITQVKFNYVDVIGKRSPQARIQQGTAANRIHNTIPYGRPLQERGIDLDHGRRDSRLLRPRRWNLPVPNSLFTFLFGRNPGRWPADLCGAINALLGEKRQEVR
jgi:hypothetical protein